MPILRTTRIGLVGTMRAGKTTVARLLSARLNIPIISFADPIKQGLMVMGITKTGTPNLFRKAAQVIGTDVVRAADPDHWVKLFRSRVGQGQSFVVDDVRFDNEMREFPPELIFVIHRPGGPEPDADTGYHESEKLARRLLESQKHRVVLNPEGRPEAAAAAILQRLRSAGYIDGFQGEMLGEAA